VDEHNQYLADRLGFTVGLNEYADLDPAEFAKIFNGRISGPRNDINSSSVYTGKDVKIPASVDWRTKGYVTPVKDQGSCGSCWAFSATGALEGQHFRATGRLVSLSEQNLLDCTRAYGNHGCDGGLETNAFEYVIRNGGIDTEASYPYRAVEGNCRYNAATSGATCSGYSRVASGSERALTRAIADIGPVSVGIDSSHQSFQFYRSGVYYEPACSQFHLDHSVLAVGYGMDNGRDMYIVKNSYGTGWGMNGYIYMSRNRRNNCGIATDGSYPRV